MPFTPIHLGPGAAIKALAGPRFSFMIFGGAQVLMDIEPLIVMIRGTGTIHGFSHSLGGALVIGLIAALTGRPISSLVLRWLDIPHLPISWPAAFAGAYVGTLSHVGFDAIMHSDMQPFWPLAPDNPLLYVISVDNLHLTCLALGVLGACGVAARFKRYGKT